MKAARTSLAALALMLFASASFAAPKIDTELASRLKVAQPGVQLGVILTFHGDKVADSQIAAVRGLGITNGVRMRNFPIVFVNATPLQIKQMTSWNQLRSIYLNAPVQLYLHQTKPLIGVDRLRTDPDLTRRNGGMPVSGKGITIAINDTGVDGTHADVEYDPLDPLRKTIQNVLVNMNDKDGLLVRPNTIGNPLLGILPPVYVEDVINTDSHGGHGTHVASTAAGSGVASGGLYQGVAPGANILGLGSGAGLFIIGQIAAFDYCFTNQFRYNIRVVNNSWGNSAVAVDADHPINVASRILHDQAHIVVIFANGNDGPDANSQNRWASMPWVINVGAATKEGRLAGFSSRGVFGTDLHPSIVTPGTGGSTGSGFTSAVIAARARVNPAANGLHTDAEIPAAFVANYTQISGTSMAAPHLAGVVANILSANPSLTPDDVKALIERTATPLSVYDPFEAGAGMANVHAAVDAAYNPTKAYGNFGFTGKGLSVSRLDGESIQSTVVAGGSNTHSIIVPPNARYTFVQLDWGGSIGEDEVVVDNTKVVANDMSLTVLRGSQQLAASDDINAGGLFGAREGITLEFPAADLLTARVQAGLFGAGMVADQSYRLTVTHYLYDPTEINDIGILDEVSRLKAYRLVYDRVMFTSGGSFRPEAELTRIELGRALMFAARVPQFIPNQPSFADLAVGTPEALIAESLRREGVMGTGAGSFAPATPVSRLEQAVALVRALRLDTQAKALANSDVTSGGQVLTDNAQIPVGLRGYVQIAIDKGLMEAFPAEVRQIAPGQFQAIPGPRFEPSRVVKRAEFLHPTSRLINLIFGE
ncbi:MAG: S8 family serine peptidase [Pyrinomonadaceae bacterium]